MKIAQIREIIRAAAWTRNDLVGGTREEFRRQQVGPSLRAHIVALHALQIPARFVDDIARREQEIAHCLAVIARWEAAQSGGSMNVSNLTKGARVRINFGIQYGHQDGTVYEVYDNNGPRAAVMMDNDRGREVIQGDASMGYAIGWSLAPNPRINTPNTRHLYRLGTDKGPVMVEANTRTSAAAKARKAGYVVHDVNMEG